ncbi:CBS domain-containing protein [Azospirillum canadense]|uniref:CBS domain-containing protein n=1 Tax=Azospirillum canadense TaxID=403962 RepID=UPI002226A15B|nr:CBS domain-containing protein [Azospirillum canadense]MCW2239146.1 CBS domain-containing protein [Azospirillum canadense]
MPRRVFEVMPGTDAVVLPPSATVHAAAVAMAERRQCVVLAMTAERLEGILTEQDVVRRVVAERRDPERVTVAEVMTAHPDTIPAADLALTGLQMMEDGGYRHLPVVHDGRVIGLISRVDFAGAEKTELEAERRCWERLG